MEVSSPPKRMTRARAAAATKSTKSAPAPARSATTTTTTTTTRTTATKRKTRADEDDDEDHLQTDVEDQNTMNKPAKTRGRPRKHVESESEPEPQLDDAPATTTRATRGRAKKPATASAVASKPEPPKTTRTRTRKTATEDSNADAPARPAKKTTRSRATSSTKASAGVITTTVATEPTPGLKSAVSRPASRIGGVVKKTVTFQEPEKENMVPAAATKTKRKTTETATSTATGMRAKPVRKPAAAGRTTRASAKATSTTAEEKKEKSPLSPKKDVQNRPLSRDASSDDELATSDKTPLKPMMKSPVKPPSSIRKPDLQPHNTDEDRDTQQTTEPAGSSVFGSPARRPPSSPWKDTLKSPAKKVDAVPPLIFSLDNSSQAAYSPAKASSFQSPAKRPQMPIKSLQPPQESSQPSRSPVKASLLQSPAKRPAIPLKGLGSPVRPTEDDPEKLFGTKRSPTEDVVPTEETVPTEEVQQHIPNSPETIKVEDPIEDPMIVDEDRKDEVELEDPSQLTFPGRLSAVLPRHADPALKENPLPVEVPVLPQPEPHAPEPAAVQEEANVEADELAGDPMEVDEIEKGEPDAPSAARTTPPQSPPKRAMNPAFGLRAKDLNDHYMSDSEDELASSGKKTSRCQDDATLTVDGVPSTPTPAAAKTPRHGLPSSAVKAATRAIRSVSRGSRLGYTPLAMQLGEWKTSSPSKLGNAEAAPNGTESKEEGFSLLSDNAGQADEPSPSRGFFDDEMRIRAEMENQAAMEAALEADIAATYDEPEFDDILITKEDIELAAEANERSVMEPAHVDETAENHAHDDSISDASQEYGDENAVPIDPTLLGAQAGAARAAPVTPMRPSAPRSFHTVSKVPLKPSDDSPPRSIKRRCASVSKLSAAKRPSSLSRNATVISYSPTKDSCKMEIDGADEESEHPPVTPAKSDIWSTIGTPARTPRRDLNPSLLRGAVVFVDVHTTEGADASTVFIDLLSQMGARCVKSWPWNPSNSADGESAMSKVGITHVVYKDGGKRTMEKVRESGGVVQCVGVGWVLDCERENEWLDEAPYYIDTSLVPRGGRNRRKSMEPKALTNLNGTLVTPMKNNAAPARDCQTVPNNHISRRDSTIWMRSPSDHGDDEDAYGAGDREDDDFNMLTPVPKTPAPEVVARFALDVTPETPSANSYYGEDSPEGRDQQLLMRTCPPKQNGHGFNELVGGGGGLLRQDKDQSVMMRLMAARRKSLQFAPKIASPLSKAWN
ncbi:hypothetical protein F5B20DRAFT_556969 [Whalleya microplaca]|nr:hypothetical protein F5B20DRAFT_556969 [Whalleya microplaca]